MNNLADRHRAFLDLHAQGCFIIPNPWDTGSARMMAAQGAKALATTSAGYAFTRGLPDMGRVSRDRMLDHIWDMVMATDLPVSADLENGFGDSPETVAETIALAQEAGASGGSIEDTRMSDGYPAYEFDLAVERIRAASDAARRLPDPFTLCARADGFMNGVYGVDEAIRRAHAFEQAGADLVYIPALPDLASLKTLLDTVSIPVNVLSSGFILDMSRDELAELGVRRISVGSKINRLTQAVIKDAVDNMLGQGRFDALKGAAGADEIDALLMAGGGDSSSRGD